MCIYLLFTLFFFNTALLHASDGQTLCFFVLLPADVCNKIAHCLDFCETDQEFFERVRDQKEVSAEHMEQLSTHRPRIENSHGAAPPPTEGEEEFVSFAPKLLKPITAYSMDQSQMIFIEKRNDFFNIPARLAIVDINTNMLIKNRFADSVKYRKHLKEISENIKGIALSRNGTMLAELQMVPHFGSGIIERMFYRDELIIKTGISEPRSFMIAEDSDGDSYKIGFNKQGTMIMMVKRLGTLEAGKTVLLVTEEEHKARSVNTLDAYLQKHMICKGIEHQHQKAS